MCPICGFLEKKIEGNWLQQGICDCPPVLVSLTYREIGEIQGMAAWIIDQSAEGDHEWENLHNVFSKFGDLLRKRRT